MVLRDLYRCLKVGAVASGLLCAAVGQADLRFKVSRPAKQSASFTELVCVDLPRGAKAICRISRVRAGVSSFKDIEASEARAWLARHQKELDELKSAPARNPADGREVLSWSLDVEGSRRARRFTTRQRPARQTVALLMALENDLAAQLP